ncbi:hypothetical protein NDU88_006616 [Pleurodeles waltl]|uniref:Uncharacterized protein n=1 Tax=Pleurodeles waltl TaxID=8319 RepID=A0AAV7VPL7_PLEWA|nr:hypothetical protein NDU88_006616 [Pleurodeles waltl]
MGGPSGSQMIKDPSLSGGSQALKQAKNLHAVDFESLMRSLARDYDYNAYSTPKSKFTEDLVFTSSEHYSDQGDDPPRKRKKKSHHQEDPIPAPKVLTFEPEDIVHP